MSSNLGHLPVPNGTGSTTVLIPVSREPANWEVSVERPPLTESVGTSGAARDDDNRVGKSRGVVVTPSSKQLVIGKVPITGNNDVMHKINLLNKLTVRSTQCPHRSMVEAEVKAEVCVIHFQTEIAKAGRLVDSGNSLPNPTPAEAISG